MTKHKTKTKQTNIIKRESKTNKNNITTQQTTNTQTTDTISKNNKNTYAKANKIKQRHIKQSNAINNKQQLLKHMQPQ